jgi:PAS domain S-box-containing protein
MTPAMRGSGNDDSAIDFALKLWEEFGEFITDLLLLLERDGRILRANRGPFGFALKDAVGKSVFDYAPTELQAELRESLEAAYSGESRKAREIPTALPDGSVRWFHTHAGLLRHAGAELAAQVVVRDITPQKAAEASLRAMEYRYHAVVEREVQLAEEFRHLLTLENKRDALVHMLVHDLRSPLTSLHFLLAIAADVAAEGSPPEVEASLREATRKTAELSDMIGDVLDVSRFEGGIMPLHIDAHDIGTIATEAVSDVPPRPSVWVIVSVTGEPKLHRCDRSVIRRVITNLVSNAVRASPEGSPVSVDVAHASERTVVSVIDSGEGVPEEMQNRIFDKFWRGASGKPSQRRGTGLGLTFCKLAIQAHGGEIGLRSEPGQGSTFFFTLPNKPRHSVLR